MTTVAHVVTIVFLVVAMIVLVFETDYQKNRADAAEKREEAYQSEANKLLAALKRNNEALDRLLKATQP